MFSCFEQYGFHQIIRQYLWLENDLKKANSAENRDARPWIIIFGHRPMYCSDQVMGLIINITEDCMKQTGPLACPVCSPFG